MRNLLPTAAVLLLLPALGFAQSIGIGTTTPDAKSALDIRASDKGLLIPRLTAVQRTGITAPPQGLMVYQTDGTAGGGPQTGFWYYAGTGGWVLIDPTPGGLTLPYSGTASTSSPAFAVSNTGTGPAVGGTAAGTMAAAVQGDNTNATSGSGVGVLGTTVSGYGVRGTASGPSGYGVEGRATNSRGVNGFSASGAALYGRSTSGLSVQAQKVGVDLGRVVEFTNTNAANDSTAAYISTAGDRPALRAVNTATSAQAAIRGVKQSASTDGIGVEGVITSGASGNAAGVRGLDQSGSGTGSGVIGLTAGGYGVRGIASASGGYGVSGAATDSYGVIGSSTSGVGVYGSSTSGYGTRGQSSSSSGVFGQTAASGAGLAGVEGTSTNSSGTGVLGTTASGYGVRGEATGSSGYGVTGVASAANGIGVLGSATGAATGVTGQASGTGRAGYFNQSNAASTAAAVEINQAGSGPALRIAGEVQSVPTGSANMLPVAYGKVESDGTIITGSGNFSVAHTPGTGTYIITFTSADLASVNMDVVVPVVSLAGVVSGVRCTINTRNGTSIANNIGAFAVDVLNANSSSIIVPESRFSFMVFKQ